ncbi:MAG: ATP-binding protein [Acidobacteriota bacterium]
MTLEAQNGLWVRSVSPEVQVGWDSMTVRGTGFDAVDEVRLKSRAGFDRAAEWTLRDDTEGSVLEVALPTDLIPGSHRVCLQAVGPPVCQTFEVVDARPPQVDGLLPTELYNTVDSRLTLMGQEFLEVRSVLIGETVIPPVETTSERIDLDIPAGTLAPGSYRVTVDSLEGPDPVAPDALTVRSGLNVEIESTTPERSVRGEGLHLIVEGRDVGLAVGGELGVRGFLTEREFSCNAPVANSLRSCTTESPHRLKIEVSRFTMERYRGTLQISLTYPDGSKRTTAVEIVERVVPWSTASWVFAFFVGGAAFSFAVKLSEDAGLDGRFAARELPPFGVASVLLQVIAPTLVLSVGFGGVIWILKEGLDALGWTLLGTLGLGAGNFFLPFLAVEVARQYELVRGRAWFGALVLGSTAVALPFWLSTRLANPWSVPVQIGLLMVNLLLLVWATGAARSKLEQLADEGPDDATVAGLLEEELLRRGKVSLERFPTVSRTRFRGLAQKHRAIHPEQDLELRLRGDSPRIAFVRSRAVAALAEAFEQARLEQPTDTRTVSIARLMNEIDTQLSLVSVARPIPQTVAKDEEAVSTSSFNLFESNAIDAEAILPPSFPLLVKLDPSAATSRETEELKSLLNHLDPKLRFAILIVLDDASASRELIRRELRVGESENLVVFGERDLIEILAATGDSTERLMEQMRAQISLLLFSPYRAELPTTRDMFYGRQQALGALQERIKDGGSVCVLGARRIGKTSILHAGRRELEKRSFAVFELNCYHVESSLEFLGQLLASPPVRRHRVDPPADLGGFPAWVDRLRAACGKPVVFSFDEIDRLLAHDSATAGEALFRMFRSLAQEGRCQFLMSGERTVLDQMSNAESAFFNFTTPVRAQLLDRPTTEKLVVDPMRLIGVQLEDPETMLESVWRYTAGHPHLVQALCEECVDSVDPAHGLLTVESLDELLRGNWFCDKVRETFWSQSEPHEKAISIGLAAGDADREEQILPWLRNLGFSVSRASVERGLRYLVLCQLLRSSDGRYIIHPPLFRESLAIYSDDQWIEGFLAEDRKNS